MDKTYNPQAIEQHWYATWEASGCFNSKGTSDTGGTPYCIMIPPPNVTGSLHMGHAFQYTIMDGLIRYQRMKGQQALWQVGTDHAGIATQMVVERQLAAQGKTRHELGRDAFVEQVWQWKSESGNQITRQLRRMGASVDWSRERFTLDDELSEAVREVFVRLHEEGLIYRGKRLVNWDPVLQTAISDLEVVQEEENGKLWHIRYPLADGAKTKDGLDYIVVATTRPETMLGDAAVAVHPDDERYQNLVAAKVNVNLPLCNRTIPLIADDFVDREFGTGCVKITPAHDFNDYAVAERHHLPLITIFDRQAVLWSLESVTHTGAVIDLPTTTRRQPHSSVAAARFLWYVNEIRHTGPEHVSKYIPAKYRGRDRFVARKQIIEDLKADTTLSSRRSRACGNPEINGTELDSRLHGNDGKEIFPQGLIEKIEDHTLKVPRGDRSGAVLEPYRTDQWFVDLTRETRHDDQPGPGGLLAITKPAIEAVESGQVHFVPDNWKNTYFQWLNNIQDWCISRQIWWGHRIPAWYDRQGQVYVGRNEAEVRQKHNIDAEENLKQDDDVLDTWFSSALWPFSTLGWPQETPEFKTFYPTSVLVTGFDIIFFWVARMIMMGLKFTGEVPFREVYIHGLVRDAEGQKMSKSKGNVLDPIDLIDGIDLEALVAKRISGLMQPEMTKKIEKATRKYFPDGIPAYGTDALRFTFASLATQGRDIKFDTGRIEGYRNFCNKLWNAARYVLMNTEGHECGQDGSAVELSLADRWIISRLQIAEQQVTEAIDTYRFDLAAQAIYEFTWNEYCDWYLEFSKPVLLSTDSSASALRGTRRTLVRVLETLLRLAHPVMPFITEEIWQRIAPLAGKSGATIMLQPYPVARPDRIDKHALVELAFVQNFILGVRNIRGEMNIAPGKPLPVLLQNGTAEDKNWLESNRHYLMSLARLASITWLEDDASAPEAALSLVGSLKVMIPLAGLIDKQAELARLSKEMEKMRKDLARGETKLANPDYVARAPTAVVEEERQRVSEQRAALDRLLTQHSQMDGL